MFWNITGLLRDKQRGQSYQLASLIFSSIPAKIMDLAMKASMWALGNHITILTSYNKFQVQKYFLALPLLTDKRLEESQTSSSCFFIQVYCDISLTDRSRFISDILVYIRYAILIYWLNFNPVAVIYIADRSCHYSNSGPVSSSQH